MRDFKASPGALKTDRTTRRALASLCRRYNVEYTLASGYTSALKQAYAGGLRTTAGMPYHKPRAPAHWKDRIHFYLIWRGETEEQIKESIAFLWMQKPDAIRFLVDNITSNADILKYTQQDYQS